MEAAGGRGEGGREPDVTALVTAQLGRPPRGRWEVVINCPFDFPAVIETAPYLDDGTPFPTLFYLTCPSAVEAVARVEASGGMEAFRQALTADSELAAAADALDDRYRRRREELAARIGIDGGEVLERGIGGPVGAARASCLHAYTAALLAATAPREATTVPGALGRGLAGSSSGAGAGARAAGPAAANAGTADPTPAWRRLLIGLGPLWCDEARCARLTVSGAVRRAAIDVGTNSVRLLVALVGHDRRVHTLVRRAEVTQLGAGLKAGGRFDPDARRRTAAAVARFVEEARGLGVETIRLVGTSAARDAEDGLEFIEGMGEELQVSARVASGPEEAVLSYVGATLDLGIDAVVIDVGGGSTEVVRPAEDAGSTEGPLAADDVPPAGNLSGDAHVLSPQVDAVSLDIGCVRGTEAWFTADPPPPAERAAARRLAREAFAPLAERFGTRGRAASGLGAASAASVGSPAIAAPIAPAATEEPGAPARRLVGVAGTITTLACLALDLAFYDSEAIHLRVFTRKEMKAQVEALAALDPEARAALPCMQEGRARVIVAGGEILLGAMEALGWEELTVSERDMLDGIVLEE